VSTALAFQLEFLRVRVLASGLFFSALICFSALAMASVKLFFVSQKASLMV
jgi:hypothetical protein